VKAKQITESRAQRIARGHPCIRCGEYSFKKLSVSAAADAHRGELGEVWHVVRVCGVCGVQQEMGLDGRGDIVYEG